MVYGVRELRKEEPQYTNWGSIGNKYEAFHSRELLYCDGTTMHYGGVGRDFIQV